MNEARKQRLMREALGDDSDQEYADGAIGVIVCIALAVAALLAIEVSA